jgi:hypothetical protein
VVAATAQLAEVALVVQASGDSHTGHLTHEPGAVSTSPRADA